MTLQEKKGQRFGREASTSYTDLRKPRTIEVTKKSVNVRRGVCLERMNFDTGRIIRHPGHWEGENYSLKGRRKGVTAQMQF